MQKNKESIHRFLCPVSDVKHEIGNPEIAPTILSLVLNCSKSEVLLVKEIPKHLAKKCVKIARDYAKGIPIAYATKKWYFYDLPMYITRSVLIPRMDTEILVKTVLDEIEKISQAVPLNILDLCTGSGCVAVALAKLSDCTVSASDISQGALRVARKNAKLNNVQIDFRRCNLFDGLGTFDIIVSNPPYIKTAEIGQHDASTLCEPHLALDGGEDGLRFYREIITRAINHLNKGGLLALEIGESQAEDVKELLQLNGFNNIKIVKDLNGLDRVVTAYR